jgi:hypothetical protein
MRDPIVEEVRKHRMDHTRKFNFDLAAICNDLKSIQETSGHKVVRFSAKRSSQRGAGAGHRNPRT